MGNHSHWDRHQFEENSWLSEQQIWDAKGGKIGSGRKLRTALLPKWKLSFSWLIFAVQYVLNYNQWLSITKDWWITIIFGKSARKKRLLQSIRMEAADIVYGAKISGGAILLNPFQRTFVLSKNIPVEQKWQICFKPRVLISSTKTWYNLPTISYWLDLFLHNLTANGGAGKT